MSAVEFFTCPVCGGDLEEVNKDQYRCLYCGKVHAKKSVDDTEDTLRRLFDEGKKERVDTARKNLWDAMHAEYVSSEECMGYAYILKGLVPDDYLANFAVSANGTGNEQELSAFLNRSSKEDMETFAPAVLDFMMKSLTPKTCAAVSAYIERAFSPTSEEYGKYTALYNDIAAKVNEGVFDVTLPRGAFIAYSSRDLKKAVELCDYLEENGITCFLSSRNMTHGRGAVENYEKSLETAMDSCNTFVFVSSSNSRSAGCEARSRELVYIMRKEQDAHGNEKYDYIPQGELKHRVEYLIEDYSGSSPYDAQVRSFFHGLDWATDMEDVARRIADDMSGLSGTAEDVGFTGWDEEGRTGIASESNAEYFERCRRAAEHGDAEAQYMLGKRYYDGDGTEKNYTEAVWWYQKAAEQGYAPAQTDLAMCYINRKGVERRNRVEGAKLLTEAANQGYVPAQFNLAYCYIDGVGVKQNYAEGIKWLRKLAEQGITNAQFNLGYNFYDGRIVEQDYAEAIRWFREAAEHGDAEKRGTYLAQTYLGNCYFFGKGVEQNYEEAIRWYRKAAEHGDDEGQFRLGYCYDKGFGVDQNHDEAVKWYQKAGEQGNFLANIRGYSKKKS